MFTQFTKWVKKHNHIAVLASLLVIPAILFACTNGGNKGETSGGGGGEDQPEPIPPGPTPTSEYTITINSTDCKIDGVTTASFTGETGASKNFTISDFTTNYELLSSGLVFNPSDTGATASLSNDTLTVTIGNANATLSCTATEKEEPTPGEFTGLKFTAAINGSTVGYTIGSVSNIHIQCSTDDGESWNDWNGSNKTLDADDTLCVRNTTNSLNVNKNYNECFKFTMSGKIKASGDINSMINNQGLSEYCYANLFSNCAALISAPELPATILAKGCYSYMFENCTSLVSAPALPATSLEDNCYERLFFGCISLTSAPELRANTLKDHCYMSMFYNCSSLRVNKGNGGTKIFTCPEIGNLTYSVYCMFYGTGGTFNDTDGTPSANNTYYWYLDSLKFTATKNDSSIGYTIYGSLPNLHIQYSFDNEKSWENWPDGSKSIDLDIGQSVQIRNLNNTLSTSDQNYFTFTMEGEIEASGNVTSMINNKGVSNYCYYNMFNDCDALTTAPLLPATTLKENCYQEMFSGCSSLDAAPSLPATNLASECYKGMFKECAAFVSTPALSATTLTKSCCEEMFKDCTSLASISTTTMSATTLAESCYQSMFEGCTDLASAPKLSVSTLTKSCYKGMFKNCTGLTSISAATSYATTLAESCYQSMFEGCSDLTSTPKFHVTELVKSCYESMFKDCTGLTSISTLSIKTLADYSCKSMFEGCTNLNIMQSIDTKKEFFTCPDTSSLTQPVDDMFTNTKGAFKGTPSTGHKYYSYADDEPFLHWYEYDEAGQWWNYCSNGEMGVEATEADIGKTAKITLNGIEHEVRLIDVDHLEPGETEGEAQAHCTFEFVDLITKADGEAYFTLWDASNYNYSFPTSTLNTALSENGDIYKMFPTGEGSLISKIKTVTKYVGITNNDGISYFSTSYDTKLFPLAYNEMSKTSGGVSVTSNESSLYKFYDIENSEEANNARKKKEAGKDENVDITCWLRSPNAASFGQYALLLYPNGTLKNELWAKVGESMLAVAPAFCI